MRAVRTFGVIIATAAMLHSNSSRAADTSPPQDPAPNSGRTARVVGWVSISLGAEAAVVAAATSLLFLHEQGVRDSECNAGKVCSQRGLDANSTLGSLAVVNGVAWIATAVGLGAGAILLLTHRADAGGRTVVAVSPNPSGGAISLWSTF